jgi:CheY-like chemotaxis protein
MTLLRLLMEKEGYQVVSALDGEEGLDLAYNEKPDLIALDLDMPVMDGWEFLRRAKSDPDIQDIPVVVVTAHLLPGERHRVLEAGGAGYVSKPFKLKNLINEIQKCLPV